MSEDTDPNNLFRPFTRQSLSDLESRVSNNGAKNAKGETGEDEDLEPDSDLADGELLPVKLRVSFPKKLHSTFLEDVDPFYRNQQTFLVVNKQKEVHRFSATKALWVFDPFSSIRRTAINVVVHPIFTTFILTVIILNCLLMMLPRTAVIQSIDFFFIGVYTLELIMKVIARGFVLHPFSYLRDGWNWIDFLVLLMAYLTIGMDMTDIASLRAFRILRSMKTSTKYPGLRLIASAVTQSLKNLGDVMILTLFSLFVFAVFGLQIYMGVLTQKCIKEFPTDGSWGNFTHENWDMFNRNYSNWLLDEYNDPMFCGNSSGAGACPSGYVCLQGYGQNPNYGYTSFDTFGWSYLSAIRLVTQDFWENLYQLILRTAGPWHMLFFISIIFLGSYYILSLIIAIVASTFDELQTKLKQEAAEEKSIKKMGSNQQQADVDMKDVMVLNNIVDQTAGRQGEGDNEDRQASQDKSTSVLSKITDFCCVWDCCSPWVELQKYIGLFILNPFVELFILLCILVNTLFMALDHHDMNIEIERFLSKANYIFVAIFTFEVILKIIALSPKFFFKSRWNTFDFVIVVFMILELGLEGVQGLSVLRALRPLRALRLIRAWPTFNLILSIMGAVWNLSIVLYIVVTIFALLGMQLFGANYIENSHLFIDGELPRWSFIDFMHSFMTVFRILCGEWIESMWDCMLIGDVSCVPFFLAALIVGNFVVVNIYLAIILSNFYSSTSSETADEETEGVAKAFNKISELNTHMKQNIKNVFSAKSTDQVTNRSATAANATEDSPADCCPARCYTIFPFLSGDDMKGWASIRLTFFKIVQSKYFDAFITITIIVCSIALALEDIYLPQRITLIQVLYYLDIVVTLIFVIEMLMKWIGLGFKAYFTDGWCRLDFVIVVVTVVDLIGEEFGLGDMQAFVALRALRALRPLRAISRSEGMRVVVNALLQTVPSIFNVLLVCATFWLLFAIIGVQLFAGKFYKCVDDNGTILSFEIVPDRNACMVENYTWENSKMNFDHVGNAYLSLIQVATFKGWIQIMNDAVDSREVDKQPIRETNIYMYYYFVIFILFGSFCNLNLFIGVIVDNFKKQKDKAIGSLEMFMTESQKKYYNTMKKMASKKPPKAIPRPKSRPQAFVFDMVTNRQFELAIIIFICLNTFAMSFDHYQQTESFSIVLDYLNLVFIAIFTIEAVLKIFAFRHHYFTESWNLFDFIVVVLSILGLVFSDLIEKYFVSPTLLRVMRIAKIGRVLRFLKGTKGVRTLLFTLGNSMSALFNISLLLFLIMSIFAIFGMSFFMNVKPMGVIDDVYNFHTFGQSMILLFQVATRAGWDGVFDAISNEEDCEPEKCGSFAMSVIFMLSYLFISSLIIINMFVAVILENYWQSNEETQQGLTEDDHDMFYEIWQKFDPYATQYINYDQLSDFLDALDPPLQIPKPNRCKIVDMRIPMCRGDRLFCVDVLKALMKDFFARKGNLIEDNGELDEGNEGSEPVSSTLQRQREDYCARLIQHAWRKQKLDKEGDDNRTTGDKSAEA